MRTRRTRQTTSAGLFPDPTGEAASGRHLPELNQRFLIASLARRDRIPYVAVSCVGREHPRRKAVHSIREGCGPQRHLVNKEPISQITMNSVCIRGCFTNVVIL